MKDGKVQVDKKQEARALRFLALSILTATSLSLKGSVADAMFDQDGGGAYPGGGVAHTVPARSAQKVAAAAAPGAIYELKRQAIPQGSVAAVYCEDWNGQVADIEPLRSETAQLMASAELITHSQPGTRWSGPVQSVGLRLSLSVVTNQNSGATVRVNGVKRHIGLDSETVEGRLCSSNGSTGMICSSESTELGSVIVKRVQSPQKGIDELQLRFLKPSLWGFSDQVSARCANVIMVLSRTSAQSSTVQYAGAAAR